jgi:hypothetical protein
VRKLRFLFVLPAVLMLQGCWFVFIPGSVIAAAGDALSGAKGAHCVASTARVGDLIRLSNGSTWKVESLSGTSSRCTQPEHPIRAELVPI